MTVKPQIDFSDFSKLDLRVGEIKEANEVAGSEKLIELMVDFGSEVGERTIYAGIRQWYTPSSLVGRKLVFVVNLAPKKFKIGGKEYTSQGMLVAAGSKEAVLYQFDKDLDRGEIAR